MRGFFLISTLAKEIQITSDLSFSYDSNLVTYGIGKLTGTTFGSGSKVLEYDIYGNKKKTSLTIGANTYTTEWVYNVLGNIEKVIYPTIGSSSLTVRNEYDEANNLVAVKDDGTSSPFASGMLWTPLGQLEVAEFGNNTKSSMSYDDTDQSWRLMGILTEKIGTPNTTLQEINYSYDKVSNIVERDDVKNSFTESYEYDDLNRLVEADLNGTTKTWTLDDIGNITNNNGTSYTYSGTRKQIVATVGSDSYSFDEFGNIASDGSRTYAFDWDNRLSSVTKASITTSYDYDEAGIRVKKTTPSKITQYIEKYTEIDDTDVIRHIFAGNKRIASIDGTAAVTYNHEDHLGSSNIRTDSSGTVIKSIEYLPFGEKRTQSGSYNIVKNRFTGQYEDEESDLYYYQQRYYDPILSRFITADPLYAEEMDERGVDAQELNVYAYVRNNPLKYTDETGEHIFLKAAAVAAGVAMAATYVSTQLQNVDRAPGDKVSPTASAIVAGGTAFAAVATGGAMALTPASPLASQAITAIAAFSANALLQLGATQKYDPASGVISSIPVTAAGVALSGAGSSTSPYAFQVATGIYAASVDTMMSVMSEPKSSDLGEKPGQDISTPESANENR